MSRQQSVELSDSIDTVRNFNRFYTKKIGTLNAGLVNTVFSLTEARVLYEIAHRKCPVATALVEDLGLDPGYLSRILRGFEEKELITRDPLESDRRQSVLRLSRTGKKAFSQLDKGATEEVALLLRNLSPRERTQLTNAMRTIRELLTREQSNKPSSEHYELRSHRPGDMGWIVRTHAITYSEEYGFDVQFEGLVARITADFVDSFDQAREHCWIAEVKGEPMGSVLLVKNSEAPETMAKLRLLLVRHEARGLGIGRRLVKECTLFARRAGYQKITLWTNSVLHKRGSSTNRKATSLFMSSRITVSAKISSVRPGNSVCNYRLPSDPAVQLKYTSASSIGEAAEIRIRCVC